MPKKMSHKPLYQTPTWGGGYFAITPAGTVVVRKNTGDPGVELLAIVQAAQDAGLGLPLLLRCKDILHDRVQKIVQAFAKARSALAYEGQYQLVYPIKANQEQMVVKALLHNPHHVIGLEAGSKPELMAVMGLLEQGQSLIMCNGYKDSAYIRMALIAQQMGHKVYIVIETNAEWDIILKEAALMGVRPLLGVRIRLVSKAAGLWENSGGAQSKFGLSAAQILELIDRMHSQGFLDCLHVMHCHLGSAIANIADINQCMQEVAQYYVALRQLGAPLPILDVGGGLSIDYQGNGASSGCSMNYNLYEYAHHILSTVQKVCVAAQCRVPDIVTESGRALTAHHAILITNINDIEPAEDSKTVAVLPSTHNPLLQGMQQARHALLEQAPLALYEEVTTQLQSAQSLFQQGLLTLTDKAKLEGLYQEICCDILRHLDHKEAAAGALATKIAEAMAAKVFCNLSFFQSLPDAWALGQIFPIMPLSQLNQALEMTSILEDLTCDSDGTLQSYAGDIVPTNTLLLPNFNPATPYLLGFFLVGAYQEILGNLHNLFGDTDALAVSLGENGQFMLEDLAKGDSVAKVLTATHFDVNALLQAYEQQLAHADLPLAARAAYLQELRDNFSQLPYLNSM